MEECIGAINHISKSVLQWGVTLLKLVQLHVFADKNNFIGTINKIKGLLLFTIQLFKMHFYRL